MADRLISLRLPHALVERLDAFARALDGHVTRTDVVEAACEVLRLECPVETCPFRAASPAAVCTSHGQKVVLPVERD